MFVIGAIGAWNRDSSELWSVSETTLWGEREQDCTPLPGSGWATSTRTSTGGFLWSPIWSMLACAFLLLSLLLHHLHLQGHQYILFWAIIDISILVIWMLLCSCSVVCTLGLCVDKWECVKVYNGRTGYRDRRPFCGWLALQLDHAPCAHHLKGLDMITQTRGSQIASLRALNVPNFTRSGIDCWGMMCRHSPSSSVTLLLKKCWLCDITLEGRLIVFKRLRNNFSWHLWCL